MSLFLGGFVTAYKMTSSTGKLTRKGYTPEPESAWRAFDLSEGRGCVEVDHGLDSGQFGHGLVGKSKVMMSSIANVYS